MESTRRGDTELTAAGRFQRARRGSPERSLEDTPPLFQQPDDELRPRSRLVACPVCGKQVPDTYINEHLDECAKGGASAGAPLGGDGKIHRVGPDFGPTSHL